MADETMAPGYNPDERFLKAYIDWDDDGWGLVITGTLIVPFPNPRRKRPRSCGPPTAPHPQRPRCSAWRGIRSCKPMVDMNRRRDDVRENDAADFSLAKYISGVDRKVLPQNWEEWASASQENNTPAVVQLCRPWRQCMAGNGNKRLFTESVAPSAPG